MKSRSDSPGEIASNLVRLIDERYIQNALVDVFDEANLEGFASLSPGWLDFTHSNKTAIASAMGEPGSREALVGFMVERTERSVLDYNQFVRVSEGDRRVLAGDYADLLDRVRRILLNDASFETFRGASRDLLEDHFTSLRGHFGSMDDARLLRSSGPITCHQYSPELQLDVMRVTPGLVTEPLLDLGCGLHGSLVFYLRSLGVRAFGFDRFVEPSPYLVAGDWLDARFKPRKWGAIISHMSFSNHFAHHHLRCDGMFENYAGKYMELLNALAPGGSFIYTPGLPFIECHLPGDRFEISRYEVADPRVTADGGPGFENIRTIGEGLYAARVMRMA